MHIGTEVANAFAAFTAEHHRPRPFFIHSDRHKRETLIILQPNIEPRLMLLDQGVLEQQSFDFVAYFNPLNFVGKAHHARSTGMQSLWVCEVARNTRT